MNEQLRRPLATAALILSIGGLAACSHGNTPKVCPTVTLQPAYPEYGDQTGVGVALDHSLRMLKDKRDITAHTGAHDTIINIQKELDRAHKKYHEPQIGDTFVYCVDNGKITSGNDVTVVGEK